MNELPHKKKILKIPSVILALGAAYFGGLYQGEMPAKAICLEKAKDGDFPPICVSRNWMPWETSNAMAALAQNAAAVREMAQMGNALPAGREILSPVELDSGVNEAKKIMGVR